MRKYLFPLLFLLSTIAGCGRDAMPELVSIDTLLQSKPDSAFKRLKEIDGSRLSAESEAYHALLYTQAQYKTFDSIVSDSIIDIAVVYYATGQDSEKRTRAYLYKGAALSEMGLRREAINWYKQAEQAADTSEYLTLGLINTRLAELYRNIYRENKEDIERYKTALKYYRKANHKPFENSTLSSLANRYTIPNKDSAYYYIRESNKLAIERNDSIMIRYNLISLACIHEYSANYQAVIDTHNSEILRNRTDFDLYKSVIGAYANLGKVDSAEMYLKYIEPQNAKQRVSYLMALEQIALAKGDYKNAHKYSNTASDLADSIIDVARADDLFTIEKRFDNRYLKNTNENLRDVNTIQLLVIILSVVVILSLVTITYLVFTTNRKTREQQMQFISQLQTELELQKLKTADNTNSASGQLRNLLESRTQMIQHILNLSYKYSNNGDRFVKYFNQYITENRQSQEACDNIIQTANHLHNNIIDYIKSRYPTLTTNDILLLSLTCLDFSAAEICVYMGYSTTNVLSASRTRLMRNRIGKSISVNDFLKESIAENSQS